MAVDLRQVMAAFLTASMFLMLGNMIKRDHIDPLLENVGGESSNVQYDVMKVSRQSLAEIHGDAIGLWKNQEKHNHPMKPCWKMPASSGREVSRGYVFFSLSNGPEHHAEQIANAVAVAKHLGATLVVPDIRGRKVGEKRNFEEVYDVEKFTTSLNGVVQVTKHQPLSQITTIRVPNKVSEDYISTKIKPIFNSKKNIKIITYFPSSTATMANPKPKPIKNTITPYECLAMFESLELQKELKQLANSMITTLKSMSSRANGHFVAVDLDVEMLKKKSSSSCEGCHNGEEIGKFLKKIGFEKDTTIYLTQSGWDTSLNALRDMFPNTFTKDAIMPVNGRARYLDGESSEITKAIDFHICTQSDVFIPADQNNLFYTNVAGKRIATGKTQILVPSKITTSTSVKDYVSPYVSKKNHIAYSCFC